jgi:hypothetical protein
MSMRPLISALVLGAVALFAHAQSADPLHSRECAAARGVLELALDDASAKRPGARERLSAARGDAVTACLGRESGNAKRSGAPEPAISVTEPAFERAPSVRPAPVVAAPAAPLAIQRPTPVTVCDAAGCWDSDGRRLNNLGPLLIAPSGPCALVAGLVQCP